MPVTSNRDALSKLVERVCLIGTPKRDRRHKLRRVRKEMQHDDHQAAGQGGSAGRRSSGGCAYLGTKSF
jgi:hypothetical protein